MVNFVGISTMLLTLCLADSYYFQNYFASGRIILTNLFAKSSILGENIITSRDFSLATPKTIEYVNSYKSYNSIPTLSLPEFAFIGRSNVGKSSLLNTLSGTNKRIATAGKNPGTTRCINIYACKDKSGPICTFVDLPGYGFAKLSKTEQDEISRFLRDYFLARGALKLVFLLVDSRRERNLMDEDMFSFLVDHGVSVAVVATKMDKLSSSETNKALGLLRSHFRGLAIQALDRCAHDEGDNEGDHDDAHYGDSQHGVGIFPVEVPVIPFSSVTGQGKSELWKVIRDNMITTAL